MAKKKTGKQKSSNTKSVLQSSKSDSIADSINTEVIAKALSTANQPVLLKLCRLCESKDGPFLNIFDADKVIAKKIEDLMPFGIEESDDLPHKICFRCSAKVEELHEFVQKCIKTQESLRKTVGKMGLMSTKTKTRTLWEEKLNQSNMSNDDICNALIKKAMEGIKDIPINPLPIEKDNEKLVFNKILKNVPPTSPNETDPNKKTDSKKKHQDVTPTVREEIEQNVPSTRASRSSNNASLFDGLVTTSKKTKQVEIENNDSDLSIAEKMETEMKKKFVTRSVRTLPEAELPNKKEKPVEAKPDKKPFNIMDHISMIKVNGVGVLFQCKLCNRNFLKKEVVLSHACAKNGGPKQEVIPDYFPPNPPKKPVVKYINTNTDGLHSKPAVVNEKPIVLDDDPPPTQSQLVPVKPKPKIGPASKVKRNDAESKTVDSSPSIDNQGNPNASQANAPTVQFPGMPSLNSRYKLVSGPNNTFTLVEEKVPDDTEYVSSDESNSVKPTNDNEKKKSKLKPKNESITNSKANKSNGNSSKSISANQENPPAPTDKPYPVGLIKRPAEDSNNYDSSISDSIAFTSQAMKKQSYTIVQTGNPSKLLISTKAKTAAEEVPKKRAKKQRHENQKEETSEEPFSVTLEDTTHPKDPGFFTFINVDPLLQPSYVLPTDNIIQESQISTSTPINNSQTAANKEKDKDKYTCNMCSEQFSREKKLLAHIHSHYNKMDEEDQIREKAQKKRGRKS